MGTPCSLRAALVISIGAAGYDLIEVPLLDPKSVDAVMTKATLEEYDIQASSSLVCSYLAAVLRMLVVIVGFQVQPLYDHPPPQMCIVACSSP
jgi:hypothetical protein